LGTTALDAEAPGRRVKLSEGAGGTRRGQAETVTLNPAEANDLRVLGAGLLEVAA